MRKLLVATHGRFASGIMETFKLIMGENEDISEISAYVEPGFDMQKEAEKKIHELNEEDELIIVADIMGGSIANTFSSYIQSEKIHIIRWSRCSRDPHGTRLSCKFIYVTKNK